MSEVDSLGYPVGSVVEVITPVRGVVAAGPDALNYMMVMVGKQRLFLRVDDVRLVASPPPEPGTGIYAVAVPADGNGDYSVIYARVDGWRLGGDLKQPPRTWADLCRMYPLLASDGYRVLDERTERTETK